jgi:hypothetical protein
MRFPNDPFRKFLSIRGNVSTIFGHDLALSSNQAVAAREVVNERKLAVYSICTFRVDNKAPTNTAIGPKYAAMADAVMNLS